MFLVFLKEMQITEVDALQMVLHIKHIYIYKIYIGCYIYTNA